jgi:hypothetical protein
MPVAAAWMCWVPGRSVFAEVPYGRAFQHFDPVFEPLRLSGDEILHAGDGQAGRLAGLIAGHRGESGPQPFLYFSPLGMLA